MVSFNKLFGAGVQPQTTPPVNRQVGFGAGGSNAFQGVQFGGGTGQSPQTPGIRGSQGMDDVFFSAISRHGGENNGELNPSAPGSAQFLYFQA